MEKIKEMKGLLTHQNSQEALSESWYNWEGFSLPTHWGGQEVRVKVQNDQTNLSAMNFQKLHIKASHYQ